ncbi:MAG: RNA-binding S4 domain-containing protein [Acholeplasmatales bacterium]|jgi:ribosomal 50S subunit-recycling heat shock protein|nr:RNA-binding S4 domain-containing protein [Acholeplasmatales bacterium]
MRLDKYLKLSRLIKRRTIAKKAADLSLVYVNDKIAKPSYFLKLEDQIRLVLGFKIITIRVQSFNIKEEMYELIAEEIK